MDTRSGDLDPCVLVYLMREKKFDAAVLKELIDRHSGVLGISAIDGDMRRLHKAASSNADARLAIQMFCYSVRKQVAAMIAALDGVDLVVFTGGIGENDEEVRATICCGLSWIGVSLDEASRTLQSICKDMNFVIRFGRIGCGGGNHGCEGDFGKKVYCAAERRGT